MEVHVTQFIRPSGRRVEATTQLPDDCQEAYDTMLSHSLRFTVEDLSNGVVSTCIEHPELGDFDISLTKNGPEVQAGMVKMLNSFSTEKFQKWLAVMTA